jgi:hypothetical protein
MDLYRIQETRGKGLGVFAARPIGKDELLFRIDLRGGPHYSLRDLEALSSGRTTTPTMSAAADTPSAIRPRPT